MADEVAHEEFRKEFAQNRADHAQNQADHEEFRKEFAQNRADHAQNRTDHEEFRNEFAQNRADHAQNRADHEDLAKSITKLTVLFEEFAHDAKVFCEGIMGINQRLDEWGSRFESLAERVTMLELRMGSSERAL